MDFSPESGPSSRPGWIIGAAALAPRAVEIAPHEHKRNHKKHKSNHAVSYSSSLEAILSSRNNTHS